MLTVINNSTGKSMMSENMIGQHVLSGKFATGFALGLLAKDVGIAAALAEQIGEDNPMGRLTRDLWAEARDAVGPGEDHTRAAQAWEGRRKRQT
jgi:3-hydroxyisobutyrate dehydrogenase